MNKKRLWALGLSLVAATALASTYAIIKPQPLSPSSSDSSIITQANSVRVAIVNEDTGTNYNGQDLKISETLINSYQSQLNYPMEVVSRATAEKGLESGLYQLMIVFPSKFSEDSLALESVSPTKALFQYKIKADKPLEIKQAEQAVLDIKGLFNKDLINIYFLSIIGNLQTAQSQVSDVVTSEESTLNTYRNFLSDPLSEYSQKFDGINAIPESLRDSYDSFNSQLGSSNESFSAAVDTERNYDSELEEIRQRQETWQLALAEKEQLLSEYNNNLADLTISEALEQLTLVKDDLVNYINLPELWDDTSSRSQAFNQNIEDLASILEQMNLSVDTTLSAYDSTIRDAVNDSLANSNGSLVNDGSVEKTLGYYIDDINSRITSQLDQYLETFRQYDNETIDTFNLSSADKQYLKNINTFIAWYQSVNNKAGRELTNRTAQSTYLTDVQDYVVEQLGETSLLTLSNVQGDVSDIELTVDEGYTVIELDHLIIPLEDGTSEVQVYYQVSPNDLTDLSVLEAIQVTATVKSVETIEVASEELDESANNESVNNESINDGETTAPLDETEEAVVDGEIGEEEIEENNLDSLSLTTDSRLFSRQYSESKIHFPFASYTGITETQATHKDVMGYLELAGLVRAYYDINLKSAQISLDNMPIGRNAVISEGDTDNLREIIVGLIKETTVNNLKDNLKISDEKFSEFEQLKLNSEELASNLEELKTNTANLVSELDKVVTQANAINEVLANRPQLDMDDTSSSNTDLVEVSVKMGSDLTTLLVASQQLLDNTKTTQDMSEGIKSSLENLSSTVTELQEEGVLLSSRVNELRNVMSEEYNSNEEFLKSFTTVLSNTKLGHANNEAVYEYLSNPIDASKIENVLEIATSNTTDTSRRDERSGFLIVIIAYLSSLIISYLKQHSQLLNQSRAPFRRVSWRNSVVPMNFLTGLAILSSLPIAVVSSQRLSLSMSQTSLLGMMIVVVVLLFTYGINLLLEKGKSYGFLATIFLLLLYFIVATQLLEVYYITDSRYLAIFSPLTYVEGMLTNFINQDSGWRLPLGIMILLLLVFGTLNAVIYRTGDRRRER